MSDADLGDDGFANTGVFFDRGRLLVEWAALLFLSTLMVSALVLSGAVKHIDDTLYDLALRTEQRPPPDDIVIIGIDFQSMSRLGRWPWPRAAQARLLNNLVDAQPKAIACDILFQSQGTMPDDEKVAEVVRRGGIYLPAVIEPPGGGHAGFVATPTPQIAQAAKGLGLSSANPDSDGIVRRTFLRQSYGQGWIPQLMSLVASTAGGVRGIPHSGPLSGRPMQQAGELLIPYAGPPGHFKVVSAADIYDNKIPASVLRGKYVLVGATAPGLLDNYPTPVSGTAGMANIEIEANILDGLLRNRMIHVAPLWVSLLGSLLVTWVLFLSIIRYSPRRMSIQGPLGSVAIAAASVIAVPITGFWAPPVAAIITRTLAQIIWSTRRLQVASDYLDRELLELQSRAGGALIETPKPSLSVGDKVTSQIMLLAETRARMRQLRQFVANVLETFPDPVIVFNEQGSILTVNRAAELFGEKLGITIALGGEIQPVLETLQVELGADGLWPPVESTQRPPQRVTTPTGQVLEARYISFEIGATPPAKGWTLHLIDMTETTLAIRQRQETMELFSHDMRSPQNAILATLEDPGFNGVPPPLIAALKRSAQRTLDMADGFVRLAKAETADYDLEVIDLYHLASDAADAVWPAAKARSVTVTAIDPDEEFLVSADRGLMTRAIVNLLDNAIKASAEGAKVELTIKAATQFGRPAAALYIADQASGMSQEQQKTLFRRFARAPRANGESRTLRMDGVGLGMTVVYTVVTRHEGTITLQSEVGVGTTFVITLPRLDPDDLPPDED